MDAFLTGKQLTVKTKNLIYLVLDNSMQKEVHLILFEACFAFRTSYYHVHRTYFLVFPVNLL